MALLKCAFAVVFIVVTIFGPGMTAEAANSFREVSNNPAAISGAQISSDLPSGQPVGTIITWTATATSTVPLEYRFLVRFLGGPTLLARDYAPGNSFTWTPIQEGSYVVLAEIREIPPSTNPAVAANSAQYKVASLITSTGEPVVTPTSNPLVFLYSVPPCGNAVVYGAFADGSASPTTTITPPHTCSPTRSTNFYISGLLSNTAYGIRPKFVNGTTVTTGPITTFTSGAIPSSYVFPAFSEPIPASGATSNQEPIVFHDIARLGIHAPYPSMFATDLKGRVVWYFKDTVDPDNQYVDRPLPGGNIAAILGESLGMNQLIRIMSPAGDPIQETSVGRLNEQITSRMVTPPVAGSSCSADVAGHTLCTITQLHHELNRLPNGHTIVLGNVEQLYPAGTQGSTTGLPVDILTDQIMDLDQNFQLDWTWNAFDNIPITRTAVLNEKCVPLGPGCPQTLQYGAQAGGNAQDWTHANAVIYSAVDHNILISIRHQDWVLKISYADATGDGHVVWHLGNQGDFTLQGADPAEVFPWFSHQHGIENVGSNDPIALFDNGNTRCSGAPPGTCNSRGLVFVLNESTMVANRTVNADMGVFSGALGWAQTLSNGGYFWTAGFQPATGNGEMKEFDSTGTTTTFSMIDSGGVFLYRGYRMHNMYSGCCGD